ncbi:MAG TPA: hypothetical protein VMG59_04480, partial [Phycisphaerae bacterium]|nr:hypothetical protein [Phycisphaerae bacterium]
MRLRWTKKWPLFAALSVVLLTTGCLKVDDKPATDISPDAFMRPNAPEDVPTTFPTAPTQTMADPAPDQQQEVEVSTDPNPAPIPPPVPQTPDIQAGPEPQPGQVLSVAGLLGTVNGMPIFVSDVLNPIADQLKTAAAQSRTEDYFREQIVQAIGQQVQGKVDDILMLHAAQASLTSDDMKEVDAWVAQKKAEIVAQYQGSVDQANLELEAS